MTATTAPNTTTATTAPNTTTATTVPNTTTAKTLCSRHCPCAHWYAGVFGMRSGMNSIPKYGHESVRLDRARERATPERAAPDSDKGDGEIEIGGARESAEASKTVRARETGGAREDPLELGRPLAARWCLDSARLSLVPGSNQLEDHTRWTGPRQALVFSSPFPPSWRPQ